MVGHNEKCDTCVFGGMTEKEANAFIDKIITRSFDRLGLSGDPKDVANDMVDMRALLRDFRTAKKTVSSGFFDVLKYMWSLLKKIAAVALFIYLMSKAGVDLTKYNNLLKLGD